MTRLKAMLLMVANGITFLLPARADVPLSENLHVFASLPSCGLLQTPCLPTPNTYFHEKNYLGFVARTRTNDEYGLPGWTRSQGARFHKGVDILPVHFEKLKQTVRLEYYDPKTKRSFVKYEPVLIPKDEIYAILDGVVVVANNDEERSGYGRYLMIQSCFADATSFISMYAHLDRLEVKKGDSVTRGMQIGWMGRTSSNSGGRSYLKAIPHCHFEIGRVINSNFINTLTAKLLYPKILGAKFDPRNIQPYNPIHFLQKYQAQAKTELVASQVASTEKNF